jgi:molybdopterin molybdotransferase
MDGYAVRAADVASASVDSPASLKCIGAVAAGSALAPSVEPRTCVRIFTGSPLPAGADAVVMQEDTRATGELIEVLDAVKPWESVRLAGEDVKQDTVIAQAGERISAARLALLGAMGMNAHGRAPARDWNSQHRK